ncbi:methyl-accepting chemotaxis protein [Pseudomonas abietaniphila]|uniref:methyl-accepting chemotaxis protein n=1 Tax=Pseudomonas abietaniphila TaxID=89065 RepID=UPI0032166D48
MSGIKNLKLRPKLLSAFGICAAITIVVAVLGQSGISRLYDLFRDSVDNNLYCITKIASVKSNVTASSGNMFKAIASTTRKMPQREIEESLRGVDENVIQAKKDFDAYRTAPLDDDERTAGDAFLRDWVTYTAAIRDINGALRSGDSEQLDRLISAVFEPVYKKLTEELDIIISSNGRQANESAETGVETNRQSTWILLVGSLVAVGSAIGLGLVVTNVITQPIFESMHSAAKVADGDLTHPIVEGGKDETGQLLRALANMQSNLKGTVQQIAGASDQLASAAEELTAVTYEGTKALVRQNDEIQQAATAVNQMTAAAEEVARSAANASQASAQTAEEAISGQGQVKQAITAMDTMTLEITDSTQRVQNLASQIRDITKVLDVIRSIAEQTNLLALNAAIEAARAGEQGRGFAVVADEVRALAHRTQDSTGEIESMINKVRQGADEAVQAMGKSQTLALSTQSLATEAGAALERISDGVGRINEQNLIIASAAEEQAQVARSVDRNLTNIQDLSAQSAAGANQTSASTQELSRLAISFNGMVAKFKL